MLGCDVWKFCRFCWTSASSAGVEDQPETVRVTVPLSGAAAVVLGLLGQPMKLLPPARPCWLMPPLLLLLPLLPPPQAAKTSVKIRNTGVRDAISRLITNLLIVAHQRATTLLCNVELTTQCNVELATAHTTHVVRRHKNITRLQITHNGVGLVWRGPAQCTRLGVHSPLNGRQRNPYEK